VYGDNASDARKRAAVEAANFAERSSSEMCEEWFHSVRALDIDDHAGVIDVADALACDSDQWQGRRTALSNAVAEAAGILRAYWD
jgi:hypothetical protein